MGLGVSLCIREGKQEGTNLLRTRELAIYMACDETNATGLRVAPNTKLIWVSFNATSTLEGWNSAPKLNCDS